MISIYDEIDDDIDDFDVQEKREAFLNYFKSNFTFLLCPTLEKRKIDLPKLDWKHFKYDEYKKYTLPSEKGVYMFMVSYRSDNLPNNSYVMYVGKAGDLNTKNTIAKRFMDYVNPSGYKDRPKVKRMIAHFKEHLEYYYAVTPAGMSTESIENILSDIFVPPCSSKDFTAEMRTLLKGVRI